MALDVSGRQTHPIHAIHFVTPDSMLPRAVTRFSFGPTSDIAVGELEHHVVTSTGRPLLNMVPVLTTEIPLLGSDIVTYAYPETRIFV